MTDGRGMVAAALGALAAALALASCTVGPDYVPPRGLPEGAAPGFAGVGPATLAPATGDPATGGPDGARDGDMDTGADTGADTAFSPAEPDAAWWRALGDPMLADLVDKALANNQTLAAARAGIREARALSTVAEASTGPRIDLLAVAWEPDLFGGGRRSVEAAEARYGAAVESARDVLLVVASEVARNYVELRADQRRMEVAGKTVALRETLARQTRNKMRMGLALDYDVAGAEAQLRAAQAEMPRLRARIAAAAHRIAVLTGDLPTALVAELGQARPLPGAPDVVPVGLPSTLLERRPDVRRAERELHAATAEIGVATADLFPRFSLTGSAGLSANRFSDLFRADAATWRIGAGILMPLFDRDRLTGRVEATTARTDAALAEYRQAVLVALEEVESNLVRYAQEQIRRRTLEQAVADSRRAVALARDLYDRGLRDIVHVLTAQRALAENEEALITSDSAAMLHLVALYKALGGGWSGVDLVT